MTSGRAPATSRWDVRPGLYHIILKWLKYFSLFPVAQIAFSKDLLCPYVFTTCTSTAASAHGYFLSLTKPYTACVIRGDIVTVLYLHNYLHVARAPDRQRIVSPNCRVTRVNWYRHRLGFLRGVPRGYLLSQQTGTQFSPHPQRSDCHKQKAAKTWHQAADDSGGLNDFRKCALPTTRCFINARSFFLWQEKIK